MQTVIILEKKYLVRNNALHRMVRITQHIQLLQFKYVKLFLWVQSKCYIGRNCEIEILSKSINLTGLDRKYWHRCPKH